jgi:predicted dehydrogenase
MSVAAAITTRPRIAFAGLGWIGRHRMQALRDSGVAEVAYLCDPVADLSGEEAQTAVSFEELLESDADAIVIATPSALHAAQTIAALERGKAVFCQKPLGRNAEETRRAIDAARANDRLLGVDLAYRYTAVMQAVRTTIASGAIGDVFAADLTFHNAYGPDKPWFYDPKLSGGGCVIDLGIHLVDLALHTLGFPRVEHVTARLFAKGQPVVRGEVVEDFATARLDLDSGVAVNMACSWNLSAGRDCVIDVRFYGTRGAAGFRNIDGSFYDFVAERWEQRTSHVIHAVIPSVSEGPGRAGREACVTRPARPGPSLDARDDSVASDEWGGRAIVAWAEALATNSRFDPAIEHLTQVAEALDLIYASGAKSS